MAAIDFPTATSNGQTFEADSGVIYTYVGTPPNGFWSGTFGTTGLTTLDGRYIAKNDSNTIQTIQTQGLKFNNGSADTILIDGLNGKIGIGTTSPSVKLQVDGTGVEVRASDNANSKNISLYGGTSANDPAITFTDALRFYSNSASAERMRIDSSGNAGIGTTSPNFLLDVVGTSGSSSVAEFSYTGGNSVYLKLANASNTQGFIGYETQDLTFYTNNTEKMRLDSSGRLLVGTSSASSSAPLIQAQGPSTGDSAGRIVLSRGSSGQGTSSGTKWGELQFENNGSLIAGRISCEVDAAVSAGESPGRLVFSTTADGASSPTERMRINNLGDVGVGTTAPTYYGGNFRTLEVAGSAGNDGGIFSTVTADNAVKAYFYTESTSDTATIGTVTNHPLLFRTNTVERMRINSSGNVGVGTTSINNKFVIASSGSTPAYFHSVNASTGTSGNDGIVMGMGDATNAYFWNYESGSIVFATNATERMRLDSSGRLGIQNSSPGSMSAGADDLVIGSANSDIGITLASSTTGSGNIFFVDSAAPSGVNAFTGYIQYDHGANILSFGQNTDVRMRIDQNGATKCSTSTSLSTRFSGNIYHLSHNHNNGNVAHIFENSGNSTPYGIYVQFSGASPDNNTQYFISCEDTSSQRFYVWSDGDVVNHDNSYGAISDVKLKQDIVDSGSQWDDLKNLRVRKFKFKSDVEAYGDEAKTLIGLVAQEAELVSPGLVKESPDTDSDNNDLGTTTKSVNYSVLYMKAVKALQEAMNRIETLELPNKNPFNISQTTSLLNNPFITFLNINGDTAGSIIQNGVNSVTYATSSDYRLKDNVVELTAAIPRLKQLAPKRFNFTAAADVTVDGFLAHEAQAVVPEAVTGSHNQIDGDGNPVMQGIDQSKLVPLLTAALQEAIGRIETLEAKVATLEGS